MQLIELPYQPASNQLFEKIIDLPCPVFLDSCKPYQEQGQYDILTANPFITLTTTGDQTTIHSLDTQGPWIKNPNLQASDLQRSHLQASITKTVSTKDPFEILKQYLNINDTLTPSTTLSSLPSLPPLPFTGGAMGYFSYDLGRRLEQLPTLAQADIFIPEMAIGIYDWSIIVNHELKRSYLVSHHRDPNTQHLIPLLIKRLTESNDRTRATDTQLYDVSSIEPLHIESPFQSNFTIPEYQSAFSKAIQHITVGDCFQINLAQRFEATVENGSAWASYKTLRQQNPAPFAAFMKHPSVEIMCLSPERFIQNVNGIIESKPIKGTRPRNADPIIDKQFASELLSSEKDCAENTMIVDLLRNDMGKNCEIGSITVPKLHALESFSSVHHLVSTITGKLLKDRHSLDLLKGCFPGGSITGAPKIRAMELIETLEPHRRALYCGSIGYIDWNGNMDMNIVIRTLLYTPTNQKIYCYAGGALVADSKVEEEYQETLVKVSKLLKILEVE